MQSVGLPKVDIKLLTLSHFLSQNSIPCSLTFCSFNSYLTFEFLIFSYFAFYTRY